MTFSGFGEIGNLRVKEAFYAATNAPAKGTFVGLKDNGIRCARKKCEIKAFDRQEAGFV